MKKLIYVLNHYSSNTCQHFFHVINFLDKISDLGVEIALIIEKCEDTPIFKNKNIKVITQKRKSKIGRILELYKILWNLQKNGYNISFIRISSLAACTSIFVGFFSHLRTFYWLSGQGGREGFKNLNWGCRKVLITVRNNLPFWFIKTFTYRFVTGPESMAVYMNTIMKVNSKKISILYNDIDLSRFSKLEVSEKNILKHSFNIPLNKKIILFVHRFSPVRKTLYYIPYVILEFFKIESPLDYHFIIAGSGPEEGELKKAIYDSGLTSCTTFLGAVPNGHIDKLFKSSDIFINPTYAEGFPRVILEAMACGLPIVTTDAGGISDILGSSQKEFMVPKENKDLFTKKLIEIATNAEKQETLKKENISKVQKYSTENVAKMYYEALFINI